VLNVIHAAVGESDYVMFQAILPTPYPQPLP